MSESSPMSSSSSYSTDSRRPDLDLRILHVWGISSNWDEEFLENLFSVFGEVVDVKLQMHHTVDLPERHATVEFKSRVHAEWALSAINGIYICCGERVTEDFNLPQPLKDVQPFEAIAPVSKVDPISPPRRRSPPRRAQSPTRRSPNVSVAPVHEAFERIDLVSDDEDLRWCFTKLPKYHC